MRAFWLVGILVASPVPLAFCAVAAPASPIWLETKEQTTCEAMQDDYCLGHFGFTIKLDGTFIAGPSSLGSKIEGRIKPRELQRLKELIEHLSRSLPRGERTCERGGLPGIKDQVDITLTTGFVARAYDLGGTIGKTCYLGTEIHSRQLHEYTRRLMKRYYLIPFPKH
jgi:hypothetical protein